MPWGASLTVFLLSILLVATNVTASNLPDPKGHVILKVDGAISNPNADGAAHFDLEMLKALGTTTIVTHTSWTDGAIRFEGVLARSVLSAVGANGKAVRAEALNDYTSVIPFEEFRNHDVILAFAMDGKRLSRRDKGPLWIIYPWDDNPDLKSPDRASYAVWQLRRLTVQ